MSVSRILPSWKNIYKGEVQANSEILLNRTSLSSFLTGRYIIEVFHPEFSTLTTIEISTVKKADNTLIDSAFNKIGESIALEIGSVVNGADAFLKIRNNENSLVSVSVAKYLSKL